MKFSRICVAFSMFIVTDAFVPTMQPRRSFACMSSFESDFASAMPPKPEPTLQEHVASSAFSMYEHVKSNLGEGVPEPPELQSLLDAYNDNAEVDVLVAKTYELMIEQSMLYDRDDSGTLTPTQFDIKADLGAPEVEGEFDFLYKYGMNLIKKGLIDVDVCKDIVVTRLIARTGKTPEEFDTWLGY
mmetsp:Transcript_53323/g.79237  ORF Transcript_53323/g.79237 Transcript_53323/m.79237 type:complete len:186 (+) Transcript_53323:63-620(+)|eukprot:CAMPEP_0195525668 /NCGR_PEP_ID=MMETSP0794_2-20130614/26219_1 /TAXON_ID=515487 /ORGANISM="Stephanopyxis turris, Strain CCMP 815" /LENGTH=185 /DNA_ID=CAMNT_0040656171 /DNA_START=58 /DNA_END=615 /DNA_ORIENTATION=-